MGYAATLADGCSMADRLTVEDLTGAVGCRHNAVATVKTTTRNWFLANPASTTQTNLRQLRTALETAMPSVTWTNELVARALVLAARDEL